MIQWTDIGGPTEITSTPSVYDAVHDTLYVGTFDNGVWKYDGTWTDIGLDGYIIWALAYDSTHDLLYAGIENNVPGAQGVWVWDGVSWTNTGGTIANYGVWALVYDDVHDLLYAGTGDFYPDDCFAHGVWKYDGANWTEVKNVLGAQLLSADNAGFEGGTGTWGAVYGSCSIASSTDWASSGTHSLKITPTEGVAPWVQIDVTAVTSDGLHTFSCKFKGIAGKWYVFGINDDIKGYRLCEAVLATGATQTLTMMMPFGAGATYRTFAFQSSYTHTAAEVIYIDDVHLSAGADPSIVSVPVLAYDPANNILYAGPENFYTDMAGVWTCVNPDTVPVWTQSPDMLVDRLYTLTFDPVQGVLYAGAYGHTGTVSDGVWSYDGAWTYLGLSGNDIWVLEYDATDQTLYVGTCWIGLWTLNGIAWRNVSTNLPDVGIQSVNVSSAEIYVGTHADGVWYTILPLVATSFPPHKAEKKSAYVSILDPTGATPLARLTEHFPTTRWTPDIFENLSFESVNRGGYTVASFTIHRPVTQFWADLQYRNQVIIGRGSEIYWEGYISKPIRSIKPDVIEVNCLGWSAELNQLWTDADITAPVGGYKMSTFINAVLLADPDTSIVAGAIETGDYAYPEGTRWEFAPATPYFDCIEQLDAGNGYNWGVWGNRAIDLRAKHSSVDWLVWTGDCEDLTISPNPDALCNYALINYTQDGSHYEQVIAQDAVSQVLYGIIKKKVDVPGKTITAGATAIANLYIASCKDLKVAAEFTCNRIFDSYGAEQYLGKVKGGQVVRIVDWLPTEETLGGVSDIATFEIKSPKYDHDNDTLAITPTEFLPSTDIQIARLQAVGY